MKKILFSSALGVALLAMTSCSGGGFATQAIKTNADSAAYALGYSNGVMFANAIKQMPGDSLDVKLIVSGIYDAINGNKNAKMTPEAANAFLQSYFAEVDQKVADANLKEGEDFLAKNKSAEGVVTTASGLQYKVDTLGTGNKATSPQDTVVVNYKGSTLDGKVFDSSFERQEPITIPLSSVIPGWTEAFQLFPEGSTVDLWIPSELAYGKRGPRPIGPNRVLHFECKLLKVKPYVAPKAKK